MVGLCNADDASQDTSLLNELLENVWNVLEERPELREQLKFRLRTPGGEDKARIEKLKRFSGPDRTTRDIIASRSTVWIDGSLSFWEDDNGGRDFIDPQAFAISNFCRHGASPDNDA
jgi:hypothetical protein